MRLNHRRGPTDHTASEPRRVGRDQPVMAAREMEPAESERTVRPLSRQVPPFKALSDQHYVFCRGIEALGDWAYGQRIHDWMETDLGTMVDPSIIYTLAKRLAVRNVVEGQDKTSPDGSGRRVRVYHVTPHGQEMMRLTRLYHEQRATVDDPESLRDGAESG